MIGDIAAGRARYGWACFWRSAWAWRSGRCSGRGGSDARRPDRWPVNLSLAVVNAVIVRVLAPASGVTFALLAADRELGLLHMVAWPPVVEWVVAVLALDLAVYIQHRLFHAVPLLWRLHRLHHADRGFDFTTGVRFHPGEIALSTLYKGAWIVAIGASPEATLLFEIILSTGSLFSHANARVPGDGFWRLAARHARHAPRAPLHRRRRAERQLRLQLLLVGSARGHLPAGAAPSPRDHAARARSAAPLICSWPCLERVTPDPNVHFG